MPKNSGGSDKTGRNSKPEKSAKKIGSGILTALLVIFIIAVVFGGVFYFLIRSNAGGLAERYRAVIQSIPLARLALPAAPDPSDPKYMTGDEIKDKYLEFRNENEALKKQLADANTKLDEHLAFREDYDRLLEDAEKRMEEAKAEEAALKEKELQMAELKATIDGLISNGDRESFKAYFEKLDPENAERIYAEIVKEQQDDANLKKFAQVYEVMDPSAAAAIFEQLGTAQLDLTVETLEAMKKEGSSAILESMTPEFAAKVTEKLNALFKGN